MKYLLFYSMTIFIFGSGSIINSQAQPSVEAESNPSEPLSILTYDHGGKILWTDEHFAEKLREAITWLDRYPSFKIGIENEAYFYDYLAENNPRLLEEIRGYLKQYAGRFGIGTCTYGQPLSVFINEESNIRQILYAIKTDRQHLQYTPTIYLMSEHAMHSQIPQILNGCGFEGAIMRTFYMAYGYNPLFDEAIGWWVGLDGSRIPTVPTYNGEGAKFNGVPIDSWSLTRYPSERVKYSLADFRRDFAHIKPLLAARADDTNLKREELVREYDGNPEYRWILLDELLSLFPKPTADMETIPNDFTVRMPWGACGNWIWNTSRKAEVQVCTAERLAAMELLLGGENREKELQRAWKNVLVSQHHDVTIVFLLADAKRFLSASLDASAGVQNASLQYIASRIKGEGIAQVTVFNPLSWSRKQWIEVDVSQVAKRREPKTFGVYHGGEVVPSVMLAQEQFAEIIEGRLAFQADLPALSVTSFSIKSEAEQEQSQATEVEIDRTNLRITTPFLETRLNPNGGIASLVDKRSGTLLLTKGKRSGFFAAKINGKDYESQGSWIINASSAASNKGLWATAHEYGFIGDIPYTLEIIFRADTPQLDCRVEFHFDGQKIGEQPRRRRGKENRFVHEQKLRFKLFPSVGENAIGVRDLPFAVAETQDRYVEGNYWTALTDNRTGLAIFNRGTMGSVREADGGFSLPLAFGVDRKLLLSGDHSYEFAIYPFIGEWQKADLHRKALAYNFPVVYTSGKPGNGTFDGNVKPLDINSENVILSAFYNEGDQAYIRMYESQGRSGSVDVSYKLGNAKWIEVDMLGRGSKVVTSPIEFKPWQIRTFLIEPLE